LEMSTQLNTSRQLEYLEKDSKYIIRAWGKVGEPVVLVEGRGPIVKDADGREYIDCSSGLFSNNAGHCHPKVVKAIQEQAAKLIQPSMRHSNIPAIELAEKLVELTPGDLSKVYFTTGGGESVEVAMKLARSYTGKYEIVTLRNAFHGLSFGSLSATSGAKYKKGIGPMLPGIVRAPHAYCYRCPFRYPECDLWCAEEIGRLVEDHAIESGSDGCIGTVMVEIIQGSGAITPPDEWLPRVREICNRHGLLLIVDEIQTGFGRTGKMFACEHYGVVPDILVLSKNVGGGLPAGAVVTTEEIAKDFYTGTTPTLAGNAVAMAAGLAVIEVLLEEKLYENAARMGDRLREGFLNMSTSKYVGEARGKGLMCGLELVKNRATKEPLSKEAINAIWDGLLTRGIITSASGPYGNVFRVQPTLDITSDLIDQVVKAFDDTIAEVLGR